MNKDKLILELEALCEQAGYRIRKERGVFRGDSCVMEGDKLIVVNKNRPVDSQIGILARVLKNLDTEQTYIKPAVRRELIEIWDRLELTTDNNFKDS